MTRLPLSLLLLLLLPLLAHADDPPDATTEDVQPPWAVEPETQRRIDLAVAKGARWLQGLQQRSGAFALPSNRGSSFFPQGRHEVGETALVLLTLAHAGYGPDHAVLKKGIGYLKKHFVSAMKGDHFPRAAAYTVSIAMLALHELFHTPPHAAEAGADSRYGGRGASRRNPCGYPGWVRSLLKKGSRWLMKHQADGGLFRYPGPVPGPSGPMPPGGPGGMPGGPGGMPGMPPPGVDMNPDQDLSNTQYVLLALWVASRCGVPVDKQVVRRATEALLAWQETDGPSVARQLDPVERDGRYATPEHSGATRDRARGFGYLPGAPPTGSMTAAGISSLAIVKLLLREMKLLEEDEARVLDQALWDGIAWLSLHYDLRSNPRGEPVWHHYWLYGLERACVLADKWRVGSHAWYQDGAALLLDTQQKDGRWRGKNTMPPGAPPGMPASPYKTDLLDTCWAILFLKKSTPRPEVPVLDRGPTVTESHAEGE